MPNFTTMDSTYLDANGGSQTRFLDLGSLGCTHTIGFEHVIPRSLLRILIHGRTLRNLNTSLAAVQQMFTGENVQLTSHCEVCTHPGGSTAAGQA